MQNQKEEEEYLAFNSSFFILDFAFTSRRIVRPSQYVDIRYNDTGCLRDRGGFGRQSGSGCAAAVGLMP
jgi:hypothetical protein